MNGLNRVFGILTFSGLMTMAILSRTSYSTTLSSLTFNELERLVRDLQEEATKEVSVKDAIQSLTGTEICGKSCRKAYNACFNSVSTDADKDTCASMFATCYNKCFFVGGSSESKPCGTTCLNEYDECTDETENKAEVFVCRNGRLQCYMDCKAPEVNRDDVIAKAPAEKRAHRCDQECDALFRKCKTVIQSVQEFFLCRRARQLCWNISCSG